MPGRPSAPASGQVTGVEMRRAEHVRLLAPDALVELLRHRRGILVHRPLALLAHRGVAVRVRVDGWVDDPGRVAEAVHRHLLVQHDAVGAVEADALGVVVPRGRLLGDGPVVGGLDARRRVLLPVAPDDPLAGATGIEADDPPILLLDHLHVAGALGAHEVTAHGLTGHRQQGLERLVPRVGVDVELLVPPREQRQQDALVHVGDALPPMMILDGGHQPVGVVHVAVVRLTPHVLHDIQSLERLVGLGAVDVLQQVALVDAERVPVPVRVPGLALRRGELGLHVGIHGCQFVGVHAVVGEEASQVVHPLPVEGEADIRLVHEVVGEVGGVVPVTLP